MTNSTATTQNIHDPNMASKLPETFLSCYEIINIESLRWGVRLYKVNIPDSRHSEFDGLPHSRFSQSIPKIHKYAGRRARSAERLNARKGASDPFPLERGRTIRPYLAGRREYFT